MNSVDETEVRRIRFVVRRREDTRRFDMEDGTDLLRRFCF